MDKDPLPEITPEQKDSLPEASAELKDSLPEDKDSLPEASPEEKDSLPESSTEQNDSLPEPSTEQNDSLPETLTEQNDSLPEASTEQNNSLLEASTEEKNSLPEASTEEKDSSSELSSKQKDSSPKASSKKNKSLVSYAYIQALKLMIEGQKSNSFTTKGAVAYYSLAKSKLSSIQFKRLGYLIECHCKKKQNVRPTLIKICNLLRDHPELIQGFGMFLPPNLNLQLQSGSLSCKIDPEEEETFSEMELSSDEEMNDDTSNKEDKDKSHNCSQENSMEVDLPETEKTIDSVSIHSNPAEKEVKDFANCGIQESSFLEKVEQQFQGQDEVLHRFYRLLNMAQNNAYIMASLNTFETELYLEVCDIFNGHDDLIEEFKAFVPNATFERNEQDANVMADQEAENTADLEIDPSSETINSKKFSYVNEPSIAGAYKFGAYEDHTFFDEIRTALGHRVVYDNFMRCVMMFNEDVITRSELVEMATLFLGYFPDILKKLKEMLGYVDSGDNIETIPIKTIKLEESKKKFAVGVDVECSSGGRNGASYRALPADFNQPVCSGRTPLCDEVLNDTWVSFPSWSEDSTFVTSCKTHYEEIMYRCEDERFELDMAINANSFTMQVLHDTLKKMNKMSIEEKQVLHLDDTLGTGGSTCLHQKSLHRLYGDKTGELVDGLKRNPFVAVPIILKRLKAKDDEWRDRQRRYNEIWRATIDHYYLKSLDHQGINFKQNDSKSFRSKNLEKEAEMVYVEKKGGNGFNTAHFVLEFKDLNVFQDSINLLLQFMKKVPGVYREDRRKIEMVIRSLIPDFFTAARCPLVTEEVDVEEETRDQEEPMEAKNDEEERSGHTSPVESNSNREEISSDLDESNSNETDHSDESNKSFVEEIDVFEKVEPLPSTKLPYTLLFSNKHWYIFFRQFHILYERLSRLLLESNRQENACKKEEYMEDDTDSEERSSQPSYKRVIEKLGLLLSGVIDYSKYEEDARNYFGIHAFVSYTLDKLILCLIRQLQQVVTDVTSKQCTALFIQNVKAIANCGFSSPIEASQIENNYFKKVVKEMEEERLFKIVWHKKERTLAIELIVQENDEDTADPIETEQWASYLAEFVDENCCNEDVLKGCEQLPVFLPRNLRKMKEYWKLKVADLEKLWESRQSAKFLKRTILTNKKRKALALLSLPSSKMQRRSSVQEGSVCISSTEAASVVVSEQTSTQDKKIDAPEERSPEAVNNKKDLNEENSELRVIITTDQDSDKPELVLVDLSGNEMGVQEESVHDTNLEVEIAFQDECPEPSAPEKETKTEFSNTAEEESEEAMVVEQETNNSPEEELADKTDDPEENSKADEMVEERPLSADKAIQDIGAELDLSSKIDNAVETAARVIETVNMEGLNEEVAIVSDSEEKIDDKNESVEEESPKQTSLLKRRIRHKPFDYSVRTRRNRSNPTYMKRRMKKGIVKTVQPGKNKRRRTATHTKKVDILDDPTFDYNFFSELALEEKVLHLVLKYVDIQDDIEVSFNPGCYKIHFVQGRDLYMYRKKALSKAKEAHQSVSEIKTSNFNAWHRVWLDRYVTPSMYKYCHDWLMKSDPNIYKLVRVNVSDCNKPPYIPYYKYKIRFYKIKTIEI